MDESGRIAHRLFGGELIAHERHIADDESIGRRARHSPQMMEHIVHRDGDSALVSEHGSAHGIADEDQVNPDFIEQFRRKKIIRRQGNDLRFPLQAADYRSGDFLAHEGPV